MAHTEYMEDLDLQDLAQLEKAMPKACKRALEAYKVCTAIYQENGQCKAQEDLVKICYKNKGVARRRDRVGGAKLQ